MRHRALRKAAPALILLVGIGCAATTVKKNPGPHDRGLRYYLPKPYLLVERAELPKDAAGKTTELSKDLVRLKIDYLPDFTEEYAIHIRTGVGTNDTQVTLADGWRLDKLEVNVDSKATQFVEAVTKLLGTDPKLLQGPPKPTVKAGGGGPALADDLPALTVEAHDIPLGYYEAVVSAGPDGAKRLYGWRYVGFAPYANCPLEPTGAAAGCCQQADLYGLVSVGKKMYFRRLSDLAARPVAVKSGPTAPPLAAPPAPATGTPAAPDTAGQPPAPVGSQPPGGDGTGYIVIPAPLKDLPVQPKR